MRNGHWDEAFGTSLAAHRRAAGLTQEQLADRAELSVRAISSLECGDRHPRRLTLDRLAKALDLTLDQHVELAAVATRGRRRPGPPGPLLPTGGRAVPFVGHRAELTELRAHLRGIGPALLVYTGEAGIGKSRLLAETISMASRAGLPVLAAAGRRLADPYAPIAEALADHVRRTGPGALAPQLHGCVGLELMLPELSGHAALRPGGRQPATAGQQRRLVLDATAQFLDNIAGTRRLLLVLDDVQWANPEAAELLVHLMRRVGPRLRAVVACRPGEVQQEGLIGQCVADLVRWQLLRGHRLHPLRHPDADDLVTAAVEATPLAGPQPPVLAPVTRASILRRAGGLPLFVVELAQAAVSGGSELPWHLRLAAVQHLARLPQPAVQLLHRAALLGPIVTAEELTRTSLPVEEVLDGLEVARRFGILDETQYGFRFRYPLVREVLAESLGPSRRRLWRRDLGGIKAASRHPGRAAIQRSTS